MFFKIRNKHTREGFTLIELLVVIAIIGLLSSIILASLNTARAKGRDAARILAIKQLKNALELYHVDHGSYPQISLSNNPVNGLPGYWGTDTNSFLSSFLSPTYISKVPDDPLYDGSSNTYGYQWQYETDASTSDSYGLLVYSEKMQHYCVTGMTPSPSWWSQNFNGGTTTCSF